MERTSSCSFPQCDCNLEDNGSHACKSYEHEVIAGITQPLLNDREYARSEMDKVLPAERIMAEATRALAESSVFKQPKPPKRLLSILSSADRKKYPMATGLLDYFPDALAMVSHISFKANEKHNPGQALGWSRDKSSDHPDCELRHMVERGTIDPEGLMHSAEKAWRALAELQLELEKHYGLDLPKAAYYSKPV